MMKHEMRAPEASNSNQEYRGPSPDDVQGAPPPVLLPRFHHSVHQPQYATTTPPSPTERTPTPVGFHHPQVDPTSPTSVYNSRIYGDASTSRSFLEYDMRNRLAHEIRTHNRTWREECTNQERESNRRRIENALRTHAPSYDELLLIVSAIDEELLHISSHSKFQYFDSAMDFQRTLESGCTTSYGP
ncbi:hypothetical protein Ae201684_000895 [Aphanomyces euteiches]|uniref:Uncharacterized protein n=1 Tax=Aphanomyces euteiches TaxID=100861 RepID=A0A6G0XV33_9STRA|nr:hypothetical protein Ae201684_000895 [Aphanomyces euteiches]KAH9141510.1 hypothetical protein AeRB84_014290 [Aphanomyces euteiches]